MLLAQSTWMDVRDYLEGSRGIIIPIGATEQHGPTGLIGTDAICADAIARRAGEEAGAMVAPVIAVGMSEHHMAFPGSMTLKPSTLLLVVRDCVLSLYRHGFNRFFFINGHGGNTATVRTAFSEIYAEAPRIPDRFPPRCKVANWWDAPEISRLAKEFFGRGEGSHATPGEISVTLHVLPDVPGRTWNVPDYQPVTGDIHTCEEFREKFPTGVIGADPWLASAEHGQTLYQAAARELASMYKKFLTEE